MSQARTIASYEFESEVLDSDTPVLVDFYATWCPPCRMIAPVLDQLAGEFAGHVKVVKVNIDQSPELAEQLLVSAVPTLVAFAGGRVVDRIEGALPAAALRARLSRLAGSAPRSAWAS